MTVITKLSALIASTALLSLAAYSNNGFAHPPGGHDMPRKYRTMDQPEAQPSVEPSQDNIDVQKTDAAKLSKECQAMMKNMKAENYEGGKSVEVKDMKAKMQKCMADTKIPTSEDK